MSPFAILKRTLFWSYGRGTWQYDIMCVLILAFIFLIPASVFDDPEASSRRAGLGGLHQTFVPAPAQGEPLEAAIARAVGGEEVDRLEAVRNGDGSLRGYKVWTRPRTGAQR